MILPHPNLIKEVPGELLTSLHRSVCKIRSNPWKDPTPQSWYYNLSWSTMFWYHKQILIEMQRRGFSPDRKWFNGEYHGRKNGSRDCDLNEADALKEFDSIYPYNFGDRDLALEYIRSWKKKHRIL